MVVMAGEAKKPIKVYVSAEERTRIEELAAERNVSASEYLRSQALGGKLKTGGKDPGQTCARVMTSSRKVMLIAGSSDVIS